MVLLAALLACGGQSGAGEVYRWKDAQGVTHYSDSKPVESKVDTLRFDDETGPAAAAPAAPPSLYTPPPAAPAQPSIVMYGRPTCGYCVKAERWFNAKGLAFRNIDISASAQAHAEFKRLGGQGTPLIFVDGKPIRGFNADRFERLLFGGKRSP